MLKLLSKINDVLLSVQLFKEIHGHAVRKPHAVFRQQKAIALSEHFAAVYDKNVRLSVAAAYGNGGLLVL